MSYLQLDKGFPDFTKLVLSLWFRVPQATIDAVMLAYKNRPDVPFDGIIPLMTFGPSVKRKRYGYRSIVTGSYELQHEFWNNGSPSVPVCAWVVEEDYPQTLPIVGNEYFFTGEEYDIEPSYIGIDCRQTRGEQGDPPVPILSVNLQTTQRPAAFNGVEMGVIWTGMPSPRLEWWPPPTPVYGPGSIPICTMPPTDAEGYVIPVRTYTMTQHYRSLPLVLLGDVPEAFRTSTDMFDNLGNYGNVGRSGNELVVVPDHWHHVILSVDLTNPVRTQGEEIDAEFPPYPRPHGGSVNSYCKMWLAYDDVNLTEGKLSYYWPTQFSDPNALITTNAWRAYNAVRNKYYVNPPAFNDLHGNTSNFVGADYPVATFEMVTEAIKASGNPLGIPASGQYIDHILPVEMAELQLFTGVTLDTGIEANRRAFIDKNGIPVSPSATDEAPPPAVKLLGKKPDVLLHDSDNWIAGRNTGAEPTDKPGDNLTPTGWIITYQPGPSLHGAQTPAAEPAALSRAAAD